MTTAATIGAVVAAQLASENTPGVLSRTIRGPFNRVTGMAPTTTDSVAVAAMLVGVKVQLDGATRKFVGKACIGQVDADVRAFDKLTIGSNTWAILAAEPLTDGTATYAWLFDVEAVA